ncbi:MAG: MFS transporter [Acetobacteraceae bacterium]|nr:MFS transporter [Acetobacteraceae bacterium]
MELRRIFLRVTLPFAAMGFINQAGRIVVALVGPAIALEFGLSASGLGVLAATFFAAYALAQLPIGVAMDLFGPRRVQVLLALSAAAGFALSAVAEEPFWLAVGRFVSGAGVAGALIAVMKAHVQWYPGPKLAAMTGAAVFLGGAGALAATLPVQWLLPWIGWRGAFALLALLSLATALWIRLSVPPHPPGGPASAPRRSLLAEVAEFGRIFAHPQFTRYTPAVALTTALVFTYQGLWAGPWLRDVAGFDASARAATLLTYACGMMIGHLLSGLVGSRVQARGGDPMIVPFACMAGMALAQAVLIAGPTHPVAVHATWFVFAAAGSCGPVAYALLAQRFPPALTARVSTAMNGSMLVLVFVLQAVIGMVLDIWPRTAADGWDPAGYGWAMGLTLALQAAAIAWMVVAPRVPRTA